MDRLLGAYAQRIAQALVKSRLHREKVTAQRKRDYEAKVAHRGGGWLGKLVVALYDQPIALVGRARAAMQSGSKEARRSARSPLIASAAREWVEQGRRRLVFKRACRVLQVDPRSPRIGEYLGRIVSGLTGGAKGTALTARKRRILKHLSRRILETSRMGRFYTYYEKVVGAGGAANGLITHMVGELAGLDEGKPAR